MNSIDSLLSSPVTSTQAAKPALAAAPVATDSDGDNNGSASAVTAPASRGPATVTNLSSAAQALLGN
jgi:hypothetical protein